MRPFTQKLLVAGLACLGRQAAGVFAPDGGRDGHDQGQSDNPEQRTDHADSKTDSLETITAAPVTPGENPTTVRVCPTTSVAQTVDCLQVALGPRPPVPAPDDNEKGMTTSPFTMTADKTEVVVRIVVPTGVAAPHPNLLYVPGSQNETPGNPSNDDPGQPSNPGEQPSTPPGDQPGNNPDQTFATTTTPGTGDGQETSSTPTTAAETETSSTSTSTTESQPTSTPTDQPNEPDDDEDEPSKPECKDKDRLKFYKDDADEIITAFCEDGERSKGAHHPMYTQQFDDKSHPGIVVHIKNDGEGEKCKDAEYKVNEKSKRRCKKNFNQIIKGCMCSSSFPHPIISFHLVSATA